MCPSAWCLAAASTSVAAKSEEPDRRLLLAHLQDELSVSALFHTITMFWSLRATTYRSSGSAATVLMEGPFMGPLPFLTGPGHSKIWRQAAEPGGSWAGGREQLPSFYQRKSASEPEPLVQRSALIFSSTMVQHIGPSWARFGHLGGLKRFSRFVTQDVRQVDHVISPQSSFIIAAHDVGLSWTHAWGQTGPGSDWGPQIPKLKQWNGLMQQEMATCNSSWWIQVIDQLVIYRQRVIGLPVVGQTKLTWTGAEGQVWNVGIGPLQLCQNHRGDESVLFVRSLGYSPPPTPQINTIVLEVLRGWRTKRGVG